MKLVVELVSINKGGAEQVAVSFLNECRNRKNHDYFVFLRDNIKKQINVGEFPVNFGFFDFDERPGQSLTSFLRVTRKFRKLSKAISPDCIVSTGGHGYWNPPVPFACGFNIPHYVYGESPYFSGLSAGKHLYWYIKRAVDFYFYRRADAIFVQTEDVRLRLSQIVKDTPIQVVPNAVNGHFLRPLVRSAKLPKRGGREYRCLLVSAAYSHKNFKIIRGIVGHFEQQNIKHIRFVLTLPKEAFEDMFGAGFRDYVTNVGPLPIKDCPSLYGECDCMFLPSFLECFSASYLEAMVCGLPIVTSDLSFAHGICGEAAAYFDPTNPKDAAEKLLKLASDPAAHAGMAARGKKRFQTYSGPDQRANDILDICESLSKKRQIG